MFANDTSPRLDMAAGSVAVAPASTGVVYGLWAAFFYDGGTAGLAPFVIAACAGVVYVAFGLHRRSRLVTGFGLLLVILAPVGLAQISSVASLFVGAALLFRKILKRRKRKRRGSKLESDKPDAALENDEADAKSKPSSLASSILNR